MLKSISALIVVALVVLVGMTGIPRHAAPPSHGAPPLAASSFRSGVDVVRRFGISEPQGHLVVKPLVSFDPSGGFLLADVRERQIRRYGQDGALVSWAGQQGDGPGDFHHPAGVARLPDGRVVALDMTGRLTLFDPTLHRVTETQDMPLGPVYGMALVNDSLVAVAGSLQGRQDSPLVHTWNLRSRKIVASFGRVPEHPAAFDGAYSFTGSTAVAVRDGLVAVVFALDNHVQEFRPDGTPVRVIAIPWQNFRPLRDPLPPQSDDATVERWLASFSAVSSLSWLRDGTLLVEYLDVSGPEERWNLVGVAPDGTRRFEYPDTPRLLATTPDDKMVLLDPDAELPNQWITAAFRR